MAAVHAHCLLPYIVSCMENNSWPATVLAATSAMDSDPEFVVWPGDLEASGDHGHRMLR